MGPGFESRTNVTVEELEAAPAFDERLLTVALRRARLLRCALRGLNAKAAAKIVGCSMQTAQQVYRDPAFRRRVNEQFAGVFSDVDAAYAAAQLSIHERIEGVAGRAFELLEEIMEDETKQPALRVKVAQDFLDRNPETQAGHIVTAREEFVEALAAARSAASDMDNVVSMKKRA
jgi:hypothetical protein